MGAYTERLRFTDWHEPEPECSWRDTEKPEDDVQRRLALIDECVREGIVFRFDDSQVADILALAQNLIAVQDSPADRSLEARFMEYAEKWTRETMHVSSTTKLLVHPSYRAITGMGPAAVPLLLRDMERNRRLWFWALADITGENPVDPQDAGDVQEMIDAWLKWGRRKGLL